MKTHETVAVPPRPPLESDDVPSAAGTGQPGPYRPEQSQQGNTAPSLRRGRPARGSSLGYAAAHLGSGGVAGLGAIGSTYGSGGVAVAGGLVAGGAVSAYVARRACRTSVRRAGGGVRAASRSLASDGKLHQPGRRAGGPVGRGGRGGMLTGRRAGIGRAVAGARPGTRTGLLNGTRSGGRALLGGRSPVTGGGRSTGSVRMSRRGGAGGASGRTGLFGGGRPRGTGLSGGQSSRGGPDLPSRRGSGGSAASTGKGPGTGKGSSARGKIWTSVLGLRKKGNKDNSATKFTKNRGKRGDHDGPPQVPPFVVDADSPLGDQPKRGKANQVPDSRRQRGASTGGKNMGHVSDSADIVVTAIAKADISSARKLDAVFDDLAGFEAKVATAKRQLAARIAEEFPADSSISEHVSQSASLQARLGEALAEVRSLFHRAHTHEWERLDSPRRNEHAWDVTHNQE